MGLTGNFGSVELDGEQLNASGTSIELSGCEDASLHVAIVQGGNIAHGPARTSAGAWVANRLSAEGFSAGDALGLASQTLVTVSDGTLPSFVTFTWSESIVIAGEGE
ncbi:MAG: hypothetical protein V7607_930 [Solirubrobacteraceae bacterium]